MTRRLTTLIHAWNACADWIPQTNGIVSELASLWGRGSADWLPRGFTSRILRTVMYHRAPPIRFINYRMIAFDLLRFM